ncbi:MAG: HAD family hydrolase [Oscillospiraceae bacterium]
MAESIKDMLVVSDIDGTLLRAGYGIPKQNLDAIERFVGRGGRFTVATGRSIPSVRNYVNWITPSAPVILCNGSMIYDFETEKILYERTLDNAARELVIELAAEFPEIGIELHKSGDILAVRTNEQVINHTQVEHIPFTLVDMDSAEDGWNKVLFAGTPEHINHLSVFIEKRIADDERYRRYTFVRTGDIYFELVPIEVNKGSGLRKLAELLGVGMADTVAVGDYYNDIAMLDAAGYAAAVSDAPPEVRAFADITLKSCLQGGVGELLDSLDSLCAGYEQLKLDLDME